MNNLAKPKLKLMALQYIKPINKNWTLYIGLHKSFHNKGIEFNCQYRYHGSHPGFTLFIQIWNRYFEVEITDNRHYEE